MNQKFGEQIDNSMTGPGYKKYRKQQSRRLMRRLGKKFTDLAPKKYSYHGYTS